MNDILLYEKVPVIERNFPVKIQFAKNYKGLHAHWHEHLELLLFVGEGCDVNCNGENIRALKDDLIIVNSNEIHSFSSNDVVEHFYILIWPEFFEDIDFENIILTTHIKKDAFVKECILNIYEEYVNKKPGYDMQIKAYAYSLMAYLMRNYTKERISEHDMTLKKARIKRLDKILKYISDNYQEDITTAKIAKMCFLSESYLCRFFKNAMGVSITSYINKIRVEKAAILLKNTDESVTDIAFNVGFSDLNYFSRTFKKIMNCTPKEYKK